ncbi:hypothetical protein GLYMA_10G119251v4 [Glycine max]|nr:hypothetical protein GLYMA_10G119251v4 [Glycine max]KAH1137838.1 hypothetical protein GYH30_027726 [Glycine max]
MIFLAILCIFLVTESCEFKRNWPSRLSTPN